MENIENSGKRNFPENKPKKVLTLKEGENPLEKIREKEREILRHVLCTGEPGELMDRIDKFRSIRTAVLGMGDDWAKSVWPFADLIDAMEDILRIRLENQNL